MVPVSDMTKASISSVQLSVPASYCSPMLSSLVEGEDKVASSLSFLTTQQPQSLSVYPGKTVQLGRHMPPAHYGESVMDQG